LRRRERPNGRKPLDEIAFPGHLPATEIAGASMEMSK
jgi:hypothetical protein